MGPSDLMICILFFVCVPIIQFIQSYIHVIERQSAIKPEQFAHTEPSNLDCMDFGTNDN